MKICNINKKRLLTITGINFIIIYTLYSFNVEMIILPVLFLVNSIIVYHITKKIIISFIVVGLNSISFLVSDMICGYLCINILKIKVQDIVGHTWIGLIFTIFIYMISLIFAKGMSKIFNFKKWINSDFKINSKITIFTLFNIIIAFFILQINSMINRFIVSNQNMIKLNSWMFFLYFLTVVVITWIYIKNTEKEIEYETNMREKSQLEEYTTTLENMYTDMRRFKHDYINILSTMNGYLINEKYSDLKCYFFSEIVPLSQEIMEGDNKIELLKHIKIEGLKGLLSSKILRAQSQGIDIHIDIIEDIDEIDMHVIDLCRVIGILFDNAIEECAKNEKGIIKFGIIKNKKSIVIVIVNSCSYEVPPIYKLYQMGFSTKGENRGLGLNNVKRIIDSKYKNSTLDTIIEDGYFKQLVEIKKV